MPIFVTPELREDLNKLARAFYLRHGCIAPEGYDFSASAHPQERLMSALADEAYDFFYEYFEDRFEEA